jgi:Uma2 family endonuclease
MESGGRQPFVSVPDYLAGEEQGEIRHEYIGGVLHAMAGASEAHNTIAGNVFAAIHPRLRGGPCRAYVSDFKVHLQIAGEDLFYYPDVVVTCHQRGIEKYFLRFPTVILEVLSDSTEAIDRREKLTNYRQTTTLEEYVLVAQDRREVTLHRRSDGWAPHVISAADAELALDSLKLLLPLAAIYEGVSLPPAGPTR